MADMTARVVFLGNASSAVRSVRTLEGSFHGLSRMARVAGVAVVAGIVGSLAAATKAAIDFDRSMRNVNSIAHLNERQFQKLSKSVLALAKESGQAPHTLAEGLYDVVSSGFKANQAIVVLRASAKAATAGMTDTATATKGVVAVLNAYHLSASHARKVSDVLFKEVELGVNTFEELAQNLGDTAPAAAALGIPFSEVGAALATITKQGNSMSLASTQVARVMMALIKPSKGMTAELKHMGFESGQSAIKAIGFSGVIKRLSADSKGSQKTLVEWMGDIRGFRGIIGLTGKNLADYTNMVRQMGTATQGVGATQKAFAEQAKSISFQWDRAKASLTAAAIPVGQLLFPVLEKGARKVAEFATSVKTHMPEIKREFGDLSGVLSSAATGIMHFGRSAEGMSVLVGGGAALGFAKIAKGVAGMIAVLGAAAGPVGIATGAVALLAGGAFYLYLKTHQVTQEFKDALKAVEAFTSATSAQKQADLDLAVAHTTVKMAQQGVKEAIQARNATTKGTAAYRAAELGVVRAYQSLAQSKLDVIKKTDEKTKSDREGATQSKELTQKLNALAASHHHVADQAKGVISLNDDLARTWNKVFKSVEKTNGTAKASRSAWAAVNKELARRDAAAFAKDLGPMIQQLGAAGGTTTVWVKALKALLIALGRIPTRKEVNIIIREQTRSSRITNTPGYGGVGNWSTRAEGGFLPGPVGAAVPVLAHAGEVILNPAQQQVLGGPRFLANLFGFTGNEGPGFAAGGLVRKPKVRKSRKTRAPKRRRPRLKTLRGIAHADIVHLKALDQSEEDLDHTYGQKVREYDQSQEVYIVTDPATGVDSVDMAAVNHRLGEIDDLLMRRNKMLDTLDEEKSTLEKAIKDLRRVIAALQAEIKKEIAAARSDETAVTRLTQRIAAERRKKKPSQSSIAHWESERESKRNSARRHRSRVSDLSNDVQSYAGTLSDQSQNLGHVLPFDRQDVVLDIGDLQNERVDVAGTKLPITPGGGGITNEELLRQLGQLRLALGIQNVQAGIIGSFRAGTLSVPETGLALVHAGEKITPAGVSGGGQMAVGNVNVTVVLEGDHGGLEKFIKVKAVEITPAIARRMGRESNLRLRSGRY